MGTPPSEDSGVRLPLKSYFVCFILRPLSATCARYLGMEGKSSPSRAGQPRLYPPNTHSPAGPRDHSNGGRECFGVHRFRERYCVNEEGNYVVRQIHYRRCLITANGKGGSLRPWRMVGMRF